MSKSKPSILHERIQKHPGKRILGALNEYGTSKDILAGNIWQLRQLIILLEDPNDPAKVLGLENRQKLQSLFHEVIRLLHNFLASVATLVDHQRNLMKEDFVTENHRDEYERHKKTTFGEDPLARFLKDFRNYITHRGIPQTVLTEKIGPELNTLALSIDLEKLQDWDGWKPPSRRFMQESGPKVRLGVLLNDYELKAKAFHE